MRVLQTLALPLGHDAVLPLVSFVTKLLKYTTGYVVNFKYRYYAVLCKLLSGRWDSNPRPSPWQGDVLPLYYARKFLAQISAESAETQNRTVDTAIFSRVLYQLSYLGRIFYC